MKSGSATSNFGTVSRINHDSTKYYNSQLYKELKPSKIEINIEDKEFPKEIENTIINSSAESMKEIPDNCLHLMITSPPYNVSKEYDNNLSLNDYLNLLKNVFTETYRVLVNGGRACINIANIGRKPYIPLSDYISKMMIDIGFNMRGEIIWNKGAGSGVSMAWGSWQSASNPVLRDTHEYILIFSKGSYTRNGRGKKNTITKKQFMEWTKSIWTFNPESAKKIGHPAPFPEELPFRLIQLYSFKNDIILDPFIGSGTSGLVALKCNRKYIGYEINKDYITLAKERIDIYLQQPMLNL